MKKEKLLKRQKNVQKHLTKLVDYLNLWDWGVEVVYVPEDVQTEDGDRVGMDIKIDQSYLRATINCYPTMDNHDEEYVRDVLCHELCHIITEPLYSLLLPNVNPNNSWIVEEMREQATERVSRIALKGYKEQK